MALAQKPSWNKVKGPAGAIIMHCKDFGWKWPARDTFILRDGLFVNCKTVCPHDIRSMVERDFQAKLWQDWTSADPDRERLRPAPLIEPVQRWMKKHRSGPGPAVAAQALAAGLWTQQRAQLHGAAEHSDCLACLKRGVKVLGEAQAPPLSGDARGQARTTSAMATPNFHFCGSSVVGPGACRISRP